MICKIPLQSANCPSILDDGSGKAVGYVIGSPDVWAFGAAYPRFITEVLEGWGKDDVPRPRQLDAQEPWLLPDEEGGERRVNPECLAREFPVILSNAAV